MSVPPLPEQRRIVAEIETQFARLDAGVAALKRVQATLKRYRAAVLRAACEGRLVPTEAELARAERREYEAADVLLARILAERTQAETGMGRARGESRQAVNGVARVRRFADAIELPDGWACALLGEVADIQGGIQKQPKRAPKDNSFPFLRVANVLRGRLDLREVHRIELFGSEPDRLRLGFQDLLIVEGNGSPTEIGRMALWDGSIEGCVHQNHIIRARLLGCIKARYVEAYWNSPIGSELVSAAASCTSGLHTLSVGKVGRLPLPIPPLAEQHRIVEEVERRLSIVDGIEAIVAANLKRAERLRQAILKQAFEGKLVPQDPSDEPASVLLERIRAEREAGEKAGKNGRGGGRVKGRGPSLDLGV